jgi:hypothetical protein
MHTLTFAAPCAASSLACGEIDLFEHAAEEPIPEFSQNGAAAR